MKFNVINKKQLTEFKKTIWDFYKKNKRNFPWRETQDPYRILVSEIMLQQTQADRVVPYYKTFIKKFPDLASLSRANFNTIYPFWQGLGYNRRALSLQKIAVQTIQSHKGILPADPAVLQTFGGIGKYTANAIAIFAWNAPIACIETNIRRVFIHFFLNDKEKITDEEILELANGALDAKNSREWHWALMDYGAYLKSTVPNPNKRHSRYRVQSTFEGSLRQTRGAILRTLKDKKVSLADLKKETKQPIAKIRKGIETLTKEGFVQYDKNTNLFYLS